MPWVAFVFGWPAVGAALVAFGAAFVRDRAWPAIVGAVVAAPFCFYVSLYPRIGFAGPLVCAANCLSAWLLFKGRRPLAFACLLPFMLLSTLVAIVVIGSRVPGP